METTMEAFLTQPINGSTLSPDSPDIPSRDAGPINLRRAVILFFVAFSVIFSNVMIITAFAIEKRLRVYTNYYIINMAIADAMVGIFGMGLSMVQNLLRYHWPFGIVPCNIILIFSHTSLHVSLLMLVVISIDRWYAVYYPLRHLKQRRRSNAIRRNITVWIFGFIFWGFFIGFWGIIDTRFHSYNSCGPVYTRFIISTVVAATMFYWFPSGTIAFFYVLIYRKIRSSGSKNLSQKFTVREKAAGGADQSSSVSENATSVSESRTSISDFSIDGESFQSADSSRNFNKDAKHNSKRDHRTTSIAKEIGEKPDRTEKGATMVKSSTNVGSSQRGRKEKMAEASMDNKKAQRTLSLLILSLVIAWTPYGFIILVTAYCYAVINVTASNQCFPTILLTISLWTSWCNSLLNPIMYAIAQPLFKETILKFLFGRCRSI